MDMGAEDASDTSLSLGLGYAGTRILSTDRHRRRDPSLKFDPSPSNPMPFEPSLTLSLSDSPFGPAAAKDDTTKNCTEGRQSSPHSAVSSFSVKRENDGGSEEAERVSSMASDNDEDGSAKKKLRLTKEQSSLLEDRFKEHSTLNPKQKQALAKQLSLRPRQVEVWFQNRRARSKLKQTEVDCEALKRCCDNLTDENRRLKKELHELKELKLASPLYMQFPAATLTVCPSCERIGGGGDGAKGSPFVVAPPKPQFFNPFNHSTAC